MVNKSSYIVNNMSKIMLFKYLEKHIDTEKKYTLLDIGCGDCAYWKEFLEKNKNIEFHGIDIKPEKIALGRKNLPNFAKNIKILNVRELESSNYTKYDFIVSNSALEHIYKKEQFLRFLSKYANKNSKIIINWDYGHFRTKEIKTNIQNKLSEFFALFGVERYYTKEVDLKKIREMFLRLGLEIIDEKYTNLDSVKYACSNTKDLKIHELWYNLEEELNKKLTPRQLHKCMNSVCFVLKKKN